MRGLAATALTLTLGGCQALPPGIASYLPELPDPLPWEAPPEVQELKPTSIDAAVYQRAESERAGWLEREVARLRADLRQAEEALVSAESGLRENHSRADAVSSLAEARIQVERASQHAPWRASEIAEARAKLKDADAQVRKKNFGAAVFFVYSAKRIAKSLESEAALLEDAANARFVRGAQVNLRSGPSTDERVVQTLVGGTPVFAESDGGAWALVRTVNGRVGWVHASLLETR